MSALFTGLTLYVVACTSFALGMGVAAVMHMDEEDAE